MSLARASWAERLSTLALVCVSACGGKMGDDTALQSAGGALTEAGGTVPTDTLLGGSVGFGGAATTGGISEPLGGASTGGRTSAPSGGARPVTGGTRAFGGGTAAGGRVLPLTGGKSSASSGGFFGGAFTSGGVFASSGKPSGGGSQPVGGTRSVTSAGGSRPVGDVCMMPPESGNCDGFIQSYYFNPARGRCEPFVYGGCGGNANRFDTLQACEQRCTQSGCPIITPPTSPIWVCPQNSACYYDLTTGCRCKAESGECNTDSTCTADDAGADASTDVSDAGGSTEPLPVLLCTCNRSEWACRAIDLLGP